MDIQALFKPLGEFEAKVAELYEWYSTLFSDDAEAAFVFFQLAAEEHAHVKIIEYQRRLVRNSPKDFADVSLDLGPVEETLATVAKLRNASPSPSLEEALRAALTLETSAAEYHYKTAMKQANAGAARLLDALGTADRNHLGKLVQFAKKRGVEQAAGT
jgi:rubrerythrin